MSADFWQAEKVLVTGATGFIGAHLARRLASYGATVIAFARNPRGITGKGIQAFQGDISDPSAVCRAMGDCQTVFHCAGHISFRRSELPASLRINVDGTQNVLAACAAAKVRAVVHLSACATLGYGRNARTLLDESAYPNIPQANVYAYTKKLAEDIAVSYAAKGLPVSIANIATVYGSGDTHMNSGSIIKSVRRGIAAMPPGGTSFVAVSDLIDGLIAQAEKGRQGERYIFCTENLEYRALISRIAGVVGARPPKMAIPRIARLPLMLIARCIEAVTPSNSNRVNLLTVQIVKELFGYKYYNSNKARNDLGWRPQMSLESAVSEAYRYYTQNGLI